MKKILCIFAGLLLSGTALAAGQSILTWTQPTKDVDGNPVAALTGNKIYRGTKSDGSDATLLKTLTVVQTNYTDGNLVPGTYCYAVTAINAGGESAKSAVVCKTILVAKPGQVITITIQ